MDVFKDAWERNVRLLTEAVDDITTIDDFLAVSGMYNLRQVRQSNHDKLISCFEETTI